MGSNSSHGIHLCIIYTYTSYPRVILHDVFSVLAVWLQPSREVSLRCFGFGAFQISYSSIKDSQLAILSVNDKDYQRARSCGAENILHLITIALGLLLGLGLRPELGLNLGLMLWLNIQLLFELGLGFGLGLGLGFVFRIWLGLGRVSVSIRSRYRAGISSRARTWFSVKKIKVH